MVTLTRVMARHRRANSRVSPLNRGRVATSGLVLLLVLLYVIPAYVVNIRSEERMLSSHYGEAYLDYQHRVSAFFPRLHAR